MSAPMREVYLAPDFDATSLKVPQLRSILVEHSVYFPSTSKKADLVALFTTQVKPRGPEILAAHARVKPSGHGIIAVSDNGDETPLIVPPTPSGVKRGRGRPKKSVVPGPIEQDVIDEHEAAPAPPAKKARSRRQTSEVPGPTVEATPRKPRASAAPRAKTTSKKPKQEVEVIIEPTSPSRRAAIPSAASVAPSLSSAVPPSSSRRKTVRPSQSTDILTPPTPSTGLPTAPLPPALGVPESVRTAGRKSRTSFAPAPIKEDDSSDVEPSPKRKPRYSSDVDESGFSDFNPFQAGSEQAAEKERRRRKSSLGLGEGKRRAPRPSEWTATSAPTASILRRVGPSTENLRSPPDAVRDAMRQQVQIADEYNRVIETKMGEITTSQNLPADNEHIVVTTRQSKAIIRRKPKPSAVSTPSALSLILLSLLLFGFAGQYKSMSAANGFCDPGSLTNDVIQDRETPIAIAQECIARRTQARLENEQVPPLDCDLSALPLVPFMPRPTACTPCPAYAECAHGEAKSCIPEYILSQHPLAPLAPLFDGWPGLKSRVFPPTCKPDTVLLRQIGQLARQIERELAAGRGALVCAGMDGEGSGQEVAERVGTREQVLRDAWADRRVTKLSREQFDEIFDAAIKDLEVHGDILTTTTEDGTVYLAAARTDFTLSCRTKLRAKSLVSRWKSQLASTAAVIVVIYLLMASAEQRRKERARARELVGTVLRRLQDQEYLHYLDPVVTPQPYLPPAQLRDVVLPASESAASRARLWARVEGEIEKNANIAVREREVRGDVWKTWEWTGVGNRPIEG
ncbi:inner nuclear membrane protein enriched at telomere/subtelomere region [Apiotrichum porosum]|uniref:Inner nuclear membrane protein enriched at telomere/subtelomere region n=1 Tax=Apiotrichum porosum TaxID=105984 RepID=A0A427Y4I4_9TREE|nr:inner nuclear membrane protein enriched at telomere/subtelomere region [Apiotrichum porosum]RSH85977.1 inner nuclear membrane protein enriched at telomere/subtelomere region [Apiotrichum porosum]